MYKQTHMHSCTYAYSLTHSYASKLNNAYGHESHMRICTHVGMHTHTHTHARTHAHPCTNRFILSGYIGDLLAYIAIALLIVLHIYKGRERP